MTGVSRLRARLGAPALGRRLPVARSRGIASLKSSPFTADCSTAAAIAAAASCGEVNDLNWPWKAPIAVRLAATMTIGSGVLLIGISFICQVALLGGHSNRAIEADDFTVEVRVVDDVRHESSELVGLAQADDLFGRRHAGTVHQSVQCTERNCCKAVTAASALAASATSVCWKRTFFPSSAACAAPVALLRSASSTRAPAPTRRRAVAAPRPEPLPVTMKTQSWICIPCLLKLS